jgi:hypothetical protein
MKISKTLIAAALSVASLGAMANPTFTIVGGTSATYSSVIYGADPLGYGTAFTKAGTLAMSEAGQITFSFFAKSASYNNSFEAFYVGSTVISGDGGPLQSFTVNVGAGDVDFGYKSQGVGSYITNGSTRMGVALNETNSASALLFFNDSSPFDGDFNDLTIQAVAAVPESETYAMMLAGLGMIGTIARRRNKAKAA